jgi:uncharacterized protein YpmB
MNKKYILIIISFLILLLIVLFLFLSGNKEEVKMGPVSFDSFEIKKLGNDSFVENEKAGLRFMIPQGWVAVNDNLAGFSMKSEDFIPFREMFSSASVPKQGCWIGASVKFEKEGSNYDLFYSEIKNYIENPEYMEAMKSDNRGYELLEVDGKKALKEAIINNTDNVGEAILIWIPIDNKVYLFEADIFGENQNRCREEFNKFLSTVSITKI